MSWYLECNGKLFHNKLQAILENNLSNKSITFKVPEVYNDFDFSHEPSESLEDLCVSQARQLREQYKEVYLYYSGGCDSHYILKIFIDNNIKIDKIIMVKSGFRSADFEIEDYALPFVRKLGIPYEVKIPDFQHYESFYLGKDIVYCTQNEFWHHFRLNNHLENLRSSPKDRVNIFGKEKPKLVYENGNWYTYFIDVEITDQPNQYNFFVENPTIYSKQCHMLVSRIITQKEPDQYNQITHYNENQDFWNKSIGRYDKELFPLKLLYDDGYHNSKDKLAIQSAEPQLVIAWKKRNAKLVDLYGSNWFNQGEPALGTVGVFSNFFGLTKKEIKTVDDLYPDGFKIQ